MAEPCPKHLDAEGQSLWEQCTWIIEGGAAKPSVALQLQALAIRRELRLEAEIGLLADRDRLADLPLARLQLPDGSVPENTEAALTAWHRIAEERGQLIRKLQAAYDAVQGHGISLPTAAQYSDDYKRGYRNGVDSQRAAAREAFEEQEAD